MKILRPVAVTDAVLTSTNVAETDYAAYAGGTTYAQGAHVINVAADVHEVYESQQAGNVGHALTETAWWLLVGKTNRWKMFDASVQSQTTNADSLAVTLAVPGLINSIALLNIDAATLTVTAHDDTDGEVYNETFSLVSTSGITDFYSWCFDSIERLADKVLTDLPPYADMDVTITLTDTGATAKCGECIIGMAKSIGGTQYGASVGIRDYSVKVADDFGNYSILERAFSKLGTFEVWVAGTYTDALQTLLAGLRATPVVYIGTELYSATVIYGFFKDFREVIQYHDITICNIEIEGLT